jgi:hypothetical protein
LLLLILKLVIEGSCLSLDNFKTGAVLVKLVSEIIKMVACVS